MDTFLDVSGIVKRAKQALNFKKDSELASYLGVSRATLSNWCARNRIDFHLLLCRQSENVAHQQATVYGRKDTDSKHSLM